MKTKLILAALVAGATFGYSQNTPTWPATGPVTIGNYPNTLGNLFEVVGNGSQVGIGGTAPGLRFFGGNACPAQAPTAPFTAPYAKIGLATVSNHFIQGAAAGDFIMQNIGMTAAPITGNGKSIIFSSKFSGSNGVEQMRLNELGNLQIGSSANASGARLYVNYDAPVETFAQYGIRSRITKLTNIGEPPTPFVGVEGRAVSNSLSNGLMYGVQGYASNGLTNYGGFFSATGSSGIISNYGIWAEASGGGTANWAGYFQGNLNVNGSAFCTSSAWSSDKKLKKDIALLTNSMDKIKQLKPSTYLFKTDEFKDMNLPAEQQLGLIAQELEEIYPSLIVEIAEDIQKDDKGNVVRNIPTHKAVNYIGLIPVLIAGMQEQQKEIDAQKTLIDQLTQKLGATTGINTLGTVEAGFSMSQNEPNPFTHQTVVKYTLPQTVSLASMHVYDLSGKQLKNLPLNTKGNASITITSEQLAAGIYIYSIVADGKVIDSKRMIVAE